MDALLTKIIEKQRCKSFDEMLEIFRSLDDRGYDLPPRFAVLKARAIQVANNSHGYTLEDTEQCLLKAIKDDENYIDAYIELAFYYYAVVDDARKALLFFDQAICRSKSCLREALTGKAKSLTDLGRSKDALTCLRDQVIDEADFELIRKELVG